MPLSKEQIRELMFCVKYYQQMHLSVHSRRYREFEDLLKLLDDIQDQNC